MTLKSELTKIVGLLEKKYGGVTSLDRDNPLDQLVVLILAANSNQKKADEALIGLRSAFVDWNEVRVTALHDIDHAIDSLGAKGGEGKAALIRDVLGAIYARFNKVDLDFLLEKGDKQNVRRRERLFNFLAERSPALPALMTCYFEDRKAVVSVAGSLGRMLARLGIFKKGSSPAKIRKDIESNLSEAEQLLFLNGGWQIAESLCQRAQPDCRACPLNKDCKTAPAEIERARKAEEAERLRLRKEARKLAEKIAREARAAARKAEADKKAAAKKEAARKAAEKKKAEAEKKKAEAARKKEAARKAAEKKATAKKKSTASKKAAAGKKTTASKKTTAQKKSTASTKTAAGKKTTASKKSTAKKKTTARKTSGGSTTSRKTGASKKATKKKVTGSRRSKTSGGKKTGTRK